MSIKDASKCQIWKGKKWPNGVHGPRLFDIGSNKNNHSNNNNNKQQIMCLLKCPTISLKPSLYEVLFCLSSLRQRAISAVGHSCLSPHDVISRQVYKQTKPRLLLCMRVHDTTCLWNCPHMTYQTEWALKTS